MGYTRREAMVLVYLFALVLNVTFILFLTHVNFHALLFCFYEGSCEDLHLRRWVVSVIASLCTVSWGLKRKSLDWTGAVGGFFVGFILTFSSYCFLACLLAFFYTSTKATHFCSEKKKKLEFNYKEGGQRNWIQVLCNGGVATEFALLYLLQGHIGEAVLDFDKSYERSWLAVSVLSSLAGANGDTWASEIGTVISKMEPRLIISFRKVPIGTNGGFTVAGLVFSALGGSAVGFAYVFALFLHRGDTTLIHQALLLISVGTFAGLFGSVIDSIIGATLQYSGIDLHTGKVVEYPGAGVKHISGRPVLDNHSVNMVMCIINSLVVPTITARLYLCL